MKPTPKPFSIPCGNQHEMVEQVFESRTVEQFEAVRSIVQRDDFDFSSSPSWNIFSADIGKYKGSFAFLWYDKQDNLNLSWITPKGKIKTTINTTKWSVK